MGLLNRFEKAIDVLLNDTADHNKEPPPTGSEPQFWNLGVDFERCVIQLFDKKYFIIEEWTLDKNPDITIQYVPTGERFAVECKYRSGLDNGVLKWTYPEQLERYNRFQNTKKIPVFVVIGLSGRPECPEFMFCIPLHDAKYCELFPGVLERYGRTPTRNFYWKDKMLW